MHKQINDRIHAFIWDSMTQNNCNTYLIDGSVRVLIDPGHAALFPHVQKGLDQLGLAITDIGLVICTHAHPDHLEAIGLFRSAGVKFALHQQEWEMATSMADMVRATLGVDLKAFEPDIFLTQGDLKAGETELHVYHTPGHSPGSVCIYWQDEKALFTGDLVFDQGVGRTDLPGGSTAQLKASIRQMAQLDAALLLPGHGDVIQGAEAVSRNFQIVQSYGMF